MKLYVSNLSFMGFRMRVMKDLPKDVGIDIFIECGNDYYWKHHLANCMEGRNLPVSLHGPCMNMDLSKTSVSDEEIQTNFLWACKLGSELGAKDIVMHPFESLCVEDAAVERERSTRRLQWLARCAKEHGLKLLIENVPGMDKEAAVFNQKQFFELFDIIPDADFILDTGHAHMCGWDIPKVIEDHRDCLKTYHLHDNDGTADSHDFIGKGTIDWSVVAPTICRCTPDAQLILEYGKKTIDEVLEDIPRAKQLFCLI